MNLANADIDRIVREVLARLAAVQPVDRPAPIKEAPTPESGELQLAQPLVTLATLEGRLDGIRTLAVPSGAVVTPAARDQLRERGIALRYQARQCSARPRVAIALGAHDPRNATFLASWLSGDNWPLQQVAYTDLAAMTAEVADLVAHGGLRGVLLVDRPELAACLANRRRGVRAAVVRTSAEVDSSIQRMGCNLIAIDSVACPAPMVRRCVERLRAPESISCPTDLRTVLE